MTEPQRRASITASVLRSMVLKAWRLLAPLVLGAPALSRDGIHVHVLGRASDSDEIAGRAVAALEAIESRVPREYRRMRRHVRGIVILPMSTLGRGAHVDGGRFVYLDENQVRRGTALSTGAVLLHEATHAFVSARGIPYRRHLRARIEALCTRVAASVDGPSVEPRG